MLGRTFGADLEGVPLWVALDTIAAKTGVRFAYSSTQIPIDRRVSLVVTPSPCVMPCPSCSAATSRQCVGVGRRPARAEREGAEPSRSAATRNRQEGRITGRVTDAADHTPIPPRRWS